MRASQTAQTAFADVDGDRIRLTSAWEAGVWASRIPGAKRAGDGAWMMPATLDTCIELRKHRVIFSETLTAIEGRLAKIQRYIEGVKKAQTVEPLQPIPIKAPYTLYQHQIKAYNITLALFGRGASKKGESNAKS